MILPLLLLNRRERIRAGGARDGRQGENENAPDAAARAHHRSGPRRREQLGGAIERDGAAVRSRGDERSVADAADGVDRRVRLLFFISLSLSPSLVVDQHSSISTPLSALIDYPRVRMSEDE